MRIGEVIHVGEGESVVVKRIYRLYLWTNEYHFFNGSNRPRRVRGRCLQQFARYKDLLAEAKRRAVAAGYPKSRWMDLYDWNV
jgi:hypothetical protein